MRRQDRPLVRSVARLLRCDNGVEALEVALIGGLIVIVILVAVPTLATGVGDALDGLTAAFANVRTGIN